MVMTLIPEDKLPRLAVDSGRSTNVSGVEQVVPVYVILLGNYAQDRQESMRRFSELLARELQKIGVNVIHMAPPPIFGRIWANPHGVGKWLGYIDKFLIFPFLLKWRLQRIARVSARVNGQLIVHVSDHSNSYYVRCFQAFPHLITCHDLLAVRMARDEFGAGRTLYTGKLLQRIIVDGLERSAKVVCVSDATRKSVHQITDLEMNRTETIHNGLNYPFAPMDEEIAQARLERLLAQCGLHYPRHHFRYILHIGGNHWYKNREGVLRIHAEINRECRARGLEAPQLIMVGHSFTSKMQSFVQEHGLASDVLSLVDVTDNEDLRALYSCAKLLLFPSLEEGFGWPIIEAQACGCPVVTTSKAPMSEIGGDAAVYLPPDSVGPEASGAELRNAARAVLEVLCEQEKPHAIRIAEGLRNASRFGAEQMAAKYLRVYQQLAC